MDSIEQKEQDLLNGYIKENCIEKRDKEAVYPLELRNIIMKFLGNDIFLVFDIVQNEESEQYICDDGKGIKGMNLKEATKFGCSLPLRKSIQIDIECVWGSKKESCNVIGIISNIEECRNTNWWWQMKGYKYWWMAGASCIYFKSDYEMVDSSECIYLHWNANDIISITIDRDDSNITFYLNGKKKFRTLLEDTDLYLVISSKGDFYYKLLS